MSKKVFFLGAEDPEMKRIRYILKGEGHTIVQAKKDGELVHPGNAYEANNSTEIPDGATVFFIECAVKGIIPNVIIDHHRPGDPGYEKSPEQYWEASSLGQLCRILGIEPTQSDRVLAAMDHCFNAAMKGKCPGVTKQEVYDIKVSESSRFLGISEVTFNEKVVWYIRELKRFKTMRLGDQDITLVPDTGIGYSLEYLTAQVAAVVLGIPVIIFLRDKEGGQTRLHLCGDVTKETVRIFMEEWAVNELERIYGSPDRGYAGGYKP